MHYCDLIATNIRKAISSDPSDLIYAVSNVRWDLHPTGGWMVSTTKTITLTDKHGQQYRITVEAI